MQGLFRILVALTTLMLSALPAPHRLLRRLCSPFLPEQSRRRDGKPRRLPKSRHHHRQHFFSDAFSLIACDSVVSTHSDHYLLWVKPELA